MCKKSSGSFDIKFNNEKDFTAFGKSYARCYANFGVKATFERPVPDPSMSGYSVKFDAECGCDTFIGEFNRAYEKTFGDKKTMLLGMEEPKLIFAGETMPVTPTPTAYTIELTSCAIGKKELYKSTPAAPYVSQLAAAAPATAVNATAIDSQMNYSNTDVDPTYTQAVANTTLYAQAAARSVLADKGVDLSNSDYLKSKQWYDEVVAQMADLGFVVHSASGGNVNKSTHSGEINLKDIVTQIVSAYVAGPELSAFEQLANLLSSDPDGTGVTGFLDFWWSAASSHTQNSSVAWGPVSVDQGSASATSIYVDIDVAFKDWRSLFVSFHSENVNVVSSAITLNLDMDVYNQVEKDITKALGDNIKKHIKHQKLNFG